MGNVITQKDILKKRIPFNDNIFGNETIYEQCLDCLLEDSKFIALSILYPYEDYFEMELPKRYNNWQIRCCIELYNMSDKSNFTSYAENGWQFSKETDGLSNQLINFLTPRVAAPKSFLINDEPIETTGEENVQP